MSVGDMFARRANASEGSFARDIDKAKLLQLRQRLEAEGWIKPSATGSATSPTSATSATSATAAIAPAHPTPTVDVLAEIAAKELPMPKQLGGHLQPPNVTLTKVMAPSRDRLPPRLAGHTQVMADVYHQHLGKRNWLKALVSTLEPKLKAATTRTSTQPLTRAQAVRLEHSAAAAAAATASFAVGTAFCGIGAAVAAAWLWNRLGRPDSGGFMGHLSRRMPEKLEAVHEGPLGQSTLAIGKAAERSISQSPTLKEFSEGISRQFKPRA